jgi:hypothetical protein
VILFTVFVGPWLIRLFIRNYIEGTVPLVILAFSMFFIPQIHLPFNIFLLKKQMRKVVLYNIMNFAIISAAIFLLNFRSPSLQMISLAVVVGSFFCFLIAFWDAMSGILDWHEKALIVIFQQAAVWLCVFLYILLEKYFPSSMSRQLDTINMAIKMSISLLVCLPVAIGALHFMDMLDKVKNEIYQTILMIRSRFVADRKD